MNKPSGTKRETLTIKRTPMKRQMEQQNDLELITIFHGKKPIVNSYKNFIKRRPIMPVQRSIWNIFKTSKKTLPTRNKS